MQKPFRSIAVHLVALTVDVFLTSELSTLSSHERSSAKPITFTKDILWQGFLMSMRRLDNATDLEVACILVVPVRNH